VPTFTEFLLAPWKIFQALGMISAPGTPGALCALQDVGGGQLQSVCRVLGYEMPGFIFWASLLILVLFAAASHTLLKQCRAVARSLSRVARQIRSLPRHSPSEDLVSLRRILEKERITAHAWTQFEETLLVPPGEKNTVYATTPVDTAFSKAALIEENVHSALFNAIPGVLTGLGLLMTFVAILDGLSHVTVAANMDVKGIGGLINGLSGKFASSIVAVTCAVCFVFVERIAYSAPQGAYRELLTALASRFRRRTAEHLLQSIRDDLHEQARALGEIQGKLKSARSG
jgi:hypothetical protein